MVSYVGVFSDISMLNTDIFIKGKRRTKYTVLVGFVFVNYDANTSIFPELLHILTRK